MNIVGYTENKIYKVNVDCNILGFHYTYFCDDLPARTLLIELFSQLGGLLQDVVTKCSMAQLASELQGIQQRIESFRRIVALLKNQVYDIFEVGKHTIGDGQISVREESLWSKLS
jgi:hypothetical protein